MVGFRLILPLALMGMLVVWASTKRADGQEQDRAGKKKGTTASRPLRAADSDSPLPEGWPGATRPGEIEVKNYPPYRSAVAQAKGASVRSDGVLFFSLFNHISRSNIEMTAPVVNTYKSPALLEDPKGTGDMTMEFLYRSTNQGQAGKGVGAVVVKDHPAQSFVCLGLIGRMDGANLRESTQKLHAWLADHKESWVEDGPARRLGYHGPMTPEADRRWEVQIPVKPVGKEASAKVSVRP